MQNTNPSQGNLRTLQVIHGALMLGVIIFFSITLILHVSSGAGEQGGRESTSGIDPLTIVNFALFLGTTFMRMIVPPAALRNALKRFPQGLSENEFEKAAFPAIQASHIVNMALLEGPALFSGVIIMISTEALKQSPAMWVNAIPGMMCLIFMAMLFPSAARHEMKIKELHATYGFRRE